MTYIPRLRFEKIVRETRKSLKYVHLLAKAADAISWGILLVDLITACIIRREGY